MSSFTSPLIVSPMDNGRTWKLIKPFTYRIGSKEVVSVHAGFITDFASVPRIFWSIVCPYGKQGKAAVIHDYLYQFGGYTRKEADSIFKECMTVLGVAGWKIWVMYLAVRIFGKFSWQE